MEPFEKVVEKYRDQMINEFVAYVIATAFNMDRIWEDSCFEYECKDAMDFLDCSSNGSKCDFEAINKILKEKYSLKITNKNPIKIEKIQH